MEKFKAKLLRDIEVYMIDDEAGEEIIHVVKKGEIVDVELIDDELIEQFSCSFDGYKGRYVMDGEFGFDPAIHTIEDVECFVIDREDFEIVE